ncbi:MAG: hypothetical protein A3H95_09870 [Acidobacteria bacterium RIFCSPLOWO2_02_FULL_64_15]|nr:MAG: hypothetical protein A3H95_09870 [Acidobacteria bacterium RIFCSPLOWO2_02_FULL_64_15]
MRVRAILRTTPSLLAVAFLLTAAQARAQEVGALLNQIDFGVRGTDFHAGSDRARFERYKDLRSGGFLDRLRFGRQTDQWLFDLQADHVGYRDQRYAVGYNRFGKVKASFEWDQIPLFYGQNTSTLYADQGGGRLRIVNQAVPTGIQNGTLLMQNVKPLLGSPFELRQRRDTAAFSLVASIGRAVDVKVKLSSTHKQGEMPWGANLTFGGANEIAAPLDHRTNELGAGLEWANNRGMVRVGYDGSWFVNAIPTLVYDSPLRIADSATAGSSQGRTAMWPDSMANTVSAAAAYNLPRRSRVTGSVSIGNWSQDATLLPFTINNALTPIPLDRPTTQADARITSFNVNLTSRPTDPTWFSVRARRYNYDNRTPPFNVTQYVRLDQQAASLPAGVNGSEPFGFVRNYFDVDASVTPVPFTSLKLGYGLEQVDRTFRLFESTTEHTFRSAIDTSRSQYVTARLAYEHSNRTGQGLDEEVLDDIGEQVSLRQFDISNRSRDRITFTTQVTPVSMVAVMLSAQAGRDTRPAGNFGLRKLDTNGYSIGFDVTPVETVGVGLTYTFEDAATEQKSRQANPGAQFNDPTRDWFTDVSEKAHYVVANVDLLKTFPKTDVRLAFDWNESYANYVYRLGPNSTLAAVTPLPKVYNQLRRVSADVKYSLTAHLVAGIVYWYDTYRVNDFAMSPGYVIGNQTLADGIMLGYVLQPYTVHAGWGRLTYLW